MLTTNSNISLETGFTVGEYNSVKKSGNVVAINAWLMGSISADTPTKIGNIANASLRPSITIRGICRSGRGVWGEYDIATNGDISVRFMVNTGNVIMTSTYVI